MTRFDRTALALGALGVACAAALTACRSDEPANTAATAAAAANEPQATATAAATAAATEGASAAATTDGAAAHASPDATPAASGPVFEAMNREEREAYMKSAVMPAMKRLFAEWQPDEFGDMKCAACHGAGARDKTFEMPNPKLPRLPTDEAGWKELEAREPEAMKFMSEVVVPQMARLLGEPKYDPATHKGFGCFECHTPKK